MTSTKSLTAGILGALALTMAAQAHAELQTWRLQGTIQEIRDDGAGWTPPPVFQLGQALTIDYVIDVDAPTGVEGYDANAIRGITINGEQGAEGSAGYISMQGWGLNTNVAGNSHGIEFVSFNDNELAFTGEEGRAKSVREALSLYAAHTALNSTDLHAFASTEVRLDFGSYSVWSAPQQFAAVPEPGTAGLMLLGLAGLPMLAKRRKQAH